jgi:hypothetical protein
MLLLTNQAGGWKGRLEEEGGTQPFRYPPTLLLTSVMTSPTPGEENKRGSPGGREEGGGYQENWEVDRTMGGAAGVLDVKKRRLDGWRRRQRLKGCGDNGT